jgi:S-adenosylmethionine synthetase
MAHALTRRIDQARQSGSLQWLRPDGKAQVTIRYEDDKPVAIEKLVAAVAHAETITAEQVREELIRHIIRPVVEQYKFALPSDKDIVINGTGLWHIPGPESDAGLTGRKIVVDTYGGYARVGGGAFSGKDPSKVDRSGAYFCRYVARQVVKEGIAKRAEVQVAYAIGMAEPVSVKVDTFGTGDPTRAAAFVRGGFDFRPRAVIERLDLLRPIYRGTTNYGHFGKPGLPWEV